GDLLAGATHEQRVATGFHRQTLTNTEGGVDQEEFRCKAIVDRVGTTASVWLGVTMSCAECHSHKYDPFTQPEFYQLFAFFNNASETDIPAPTPADLAKYLPVKQAWDTELEKINAAVTAYQKSELPRKQFAWESTLTLPKERWTVLKPASLKSANG